MTILVKFSSKKDYFRFVELFYDDSESLCTLYRGNTAFQKDLLQSGFPFLEMDVIWQENERPSSIGGHKGKDMLSSLRSVLCERREFEREESRASYDPAYRKFVPSPLFARGRSPFTFA